MGGLTTALAPVLQIGSAIGSAAGIAKPFYQDSVNRKKQEQQNALNLKQAQETAALQRETLRLNAQKAEADRKSLLARTIARQRAEFGGDGIGSNGGSAEAVLQNISALSNADQQYQDQLDNLKNTAIDLGLRQRAQTNLLEQSQLQQQQNINRITDIIQGK